MSTSELNHYDAIPFFGFRSSVSKMMGSFVERDRYFSLMHFIETEKFRGVDEQYRRYLVSLTDTQELVMETAGVSGGMRRPDWESIRDRLIRCALWFQLTQNKDLLLPRYLNPAGIYCDEPLIQNQIDFIRAHISSGKPLKRVLICCLETATPSAVHSIVAKLFEENLPDELVLLEGQSSCNFSQELALSNYIPTRLHDAKKDDLAELVEGYLSHVIVLGTGPMPDLVQEVFSAAQVQGHTCHFLSGE